MSAEQSTDSPQKQGLWRPDFATRFKPGVSGNPGGFPKGTPKVSVAYARLLALSAEELQQYKPKNAAEAIALRQIISGIYGQDQFALPSAKEITDRTEGKAPQTIQVNDVSELERLIIRVQERVLAQTGRELPREVAKEHVLAHRPDLAQLA